MLQCRLVQSVQSAAHGKIVIATIEITQHPYQLLPPPLLLPTFLSSQFEPFPEDSYGIQTQLM
jgi:hypothetical protein